MQIRRDLREDGDVPHERPHLRVSEGTERALDRAIEGFEERIRRSQGE